MAALLTRLHGHVRKVETGLLYWLVKRSPDRSLIEGEIRHWARAEGKHRPDGSLPGELRGMLDATLLMEFRNLLYYRLGPGANLLERWLLGLSKVFFPPRACLSITCPSIGPGLVIKHGLGTVIDAEKVGENCLIFHDVFIGMKDRMGERPTLGSYVHISAGARLLGNITIGDHCVVAANAVVTHDMPPNSLALGIPAKIVEDAGNRDEYINSGVLPAEAIADA